MRKAVRQPLRDDDDGEADEEAASDMVLLLLLRYKSRQEITKQVKTMQEPDLLTRQECVLCDLFGQARVVWFLTVIVGSEKQNENDNFFGQASKCGRS